MITLILKMAIYALIHLFFTYNCLASYNETYDSDGKKRFMYYWADRAGLPYMNPDSNRVEKLQDSPMGDPIKILPYPLILDAKEYASMEAPLTKRIDTLQQIFKDFVLKNNQKKSQKRLIEYLFALEGWDIKDLKRIWKGKSLKDFRAFYGPDLYRTPAGQWTILEDNFGNIGGKADLHHLQKIFNNNPDWQQNFYKSDFIREAVFGFFDEIKIKIDNPLIGKKVIAINFLDFTHDDFEDNRVNEVLADLKIPTYQPGKIPAHIMQKILDGDYKAILNFHHPNRYYKDNVKFYEQIMQETKTELLSAPGSVVLGSKAFMTSIASRSKDYRLTPPETHSLVMGISDNVWEHLNEYVVKKINGIQGSGVHIFQGKTLIEAQFELNYIVQNYMAKNRLKDVKDFPFPYIAQKYIPPSYLQVSKHGATAYALDIRPLVYITGNSYIISETPWARATPLGDEMKTNVSLGGYELAVLIPKPEEVAPYLCSYFFYR